MKRTLLLLLLSVSTLQGQFLSDIPDRLSYAGLFNGTSQYFSKPSPVNGDLNGSEMVTDPGFESGIWTDTVDCAVAAQSTVQKRSGTYSFLIMPRVASSNAIARSSNITNATTNATTNKVTAEFWAYVPTGNTSKTVLYRIVNQVNTNIVTGSTAITGNTWTKLVINHQLSGTQTGVKLFVGLSATSALTDSLYVDDVSLTQAWDGLIGLWFYANDITRNLRLVGRTTNGTNSGFEVFTNSSKFSASSQVGTAFTGSAQSQPLTSKRWHFGVGVIDRTDSLRVSANGEPLTGAVIATSLGRITPDTVFIGSISGTSQFWSGQTGEMIYVRYSTLPSLTALNAWIAHASTQRFIPEPPGGGTTVLRLFGKENSAYDQSGNQGVLTNTGNTPIIPR